MTDQSDKSTREATEGMEHKPPGFRSTIKPKMENLVSDFPDMGFKKGKKVFVNGARGSMGPWEIVEVLGNGQYKLKDGDEVMQKIFDEKDLSEKPRIYGDE